MSLAQLISQHCLADAQSGKWDAVAVKLNATTIVVRDQTPISYAQLTHDLGDDARALVAGTLRAIAKSGSPLAGEVSDAHSVLLNEQVGLTIHTDSRQAIIDQLAVAGSWPDSLRDAIKHKGVRSTPVAGRIVTAEECQSEWQAEIARSAYQQLVTRRSNWDVLATSIRSRIESGELADDEAVIAAVMSEIGV